MLLEFRVKNFRSIRDEQVLSLAASRDESLRVTHTIPTGIKSVPRVVAVATLYGANASGKSNIVRAMQFMRSVVLESASIMKPGQRFSLQSFLMSDNGDDAAAFEVTIVLDGCRYQYGFALTCERVIQESLYVYKAFKPQRWFERHYDGANGLDYYEFGAGLKGPKSVWESATRDNSLFLSMAAQLNSEPLRPLFDWFANCLIIINEQAQVSPAISLRMLQQEGGRESICNFLSKADSSIADITVVSRKMPVNSFHYDQNQCKAEVRSQEVEEFLLKFLHKSESKSVWFDLKEESKGTQKMFFLAGPLQHILQNGLTLVVDEFDAGLHTLIIRNIIKLFYSNTQNRKRAQLVFTAHDTSLLDAENLYRRDQIWFVEKDTTQASILISLLAYSPRKNESIRRGYLASRYGGCPHQDA